MIIKHSTFNKEGKKDANLRELLGWNGLISARTYLRLAPTAKLLLIDESPSISGVWSKERIYPSLYAQVGHGLFEYSFAPIKAEGLIPDRYISGQTIHEYLHGFAKEYGLLARTKLETNVDCIDRTADGIWLLSLSDSTLILSDKLIWAGGATSGPSMPSIRKDSFNKPIIHSSQFGTSLYILKDPQIQRITVLGAAKSAYDTVFALAQAGQKVDWVIRENGSGPLAIMPPTLPGGLNTIDAMCTRAMAALVRRSSPHRDGATDFSIEHLSGDL